MNINEFFKNNWKAFALISTLLITGAGGYTSLLLELGTLRAQVQYQNEAMIDMIEHCTKPIE